MSRRIKPAILIATALLLFAAVVALPISVTATELLGITVTPTEETPTPETPTPETPTPETPTPETPTPETPTPETPTPETPTPETPTDPVKPPKTPKPTEVVLLPATGEYPIDPQLGIQFFIAFVFFAVIGIVLFRAVRGSKTQE